MTSVHHSRSIDNYSRLPSKMEVSNKDDFLAALKFFKEYPTLELTLLQGEKPVGSFVSSENVDIDFESTIILGPNFNQENLSESLNSEKDIFLFGEGAILKKNELPQMVDAIIINPPLPESAVANDTGEETPQIYEAPKLALVVPDKVVQSVQSSRGKVRHAAEPGVTIMGLTRAKKVIAETLEEYKVPQVGLEDFGAKNYDKKTLILCPGLDSNLLFTPIDNEEGGGLSFIFEADLAEDELSIKKEDGKTEFFLLEGRGDETARKIGRMKWVKKQNLDN